MNAPISLHDLAAGGRLLRGLPSFLRQPLRPEDAEAALRQRLERRASDFLSVVSHRVYARPRSPYRALLRLAGCEYGDLERLVHHEGIEAALRVLYRNGVYLTLDELKGRLPLRRGSQTLGPDLGDLANSTRCARVPIRSGGSRSPGTSVAIDLGYIRDRAVNTLLALRARGGADWIHANWGLPGSTTMVRVLEYSSFGSPPARWFSLVDPGEPGLHRRYRWSPHLLRLGGRLAGVPLPRPRHVSVADPLPIARWMAEILRAGRIPHLLAFASSAVRLCQAAADAGIDLPGAQFSLAGEPTTSARLAAIRRVGADAVPTYASAEAGAIGYGCLAARDGGDLHLYHDLVAVIQPGREGENSSAPAALFVSSLRATAPLVLLNVSLGDQAVVTRPACGCPLEQLGWRIHLEAIRSPEKLTAGGMTFHDRDVIRVLEEVLPTRFGGGPLDYQLIEAETQDGRPRLRLLVHPRVGPVDGLAVKEEFLGAIGRGEGAGHVMAHVWRDGEFLEVERAEPRATSGGKIQHVHTDQLVAAARAARMNRSTSASDF